MTTALNKPATIKSSDSDDTAMLLSQKEERLQTAVIGGNQVILSSLDEIDLCSADGIDPDPTYNQFSLFAENIVLAQNFTANNALIAAHTLTCADKTVLDVSGAPGQDGYGDGGGNSGGGSDGNTLQARSASVAASGPRQATPGDNGGILNVYLESLDPAKTLILTANGGKGGAGAPGNANVGGGDGMDGGNGGTINLLAVQPMLVWLTALQNILKETNFATQLELLSDLQKSVPADDTNKAFIAALANASKSADADSLKTNLESTGDSLQMQYEIWYSKFNANVEVQGGAGGVYGAGTPNGASGAGGGSGTSNTTFVGSLGTAASIPVPPFVFVHPSQCAMVLEKAKIAYAFLDPVKDKDVVTTLAGQFDLIQQRTAPFVDLDPTSDLAKYYAAHESEYGIVNGVATLASLNAEAKKYLCYLQSGLDYFGYQTNYVPLTSLIAINKIAVGNLVKSFAVLDDAYQKQFAQLKARQADNTYVSTARDQLTQQFAQIDVDMPQLKSSIATSCAVIDAFQTVLDQKRKAVDDAIKQYADDVSRNFDFDLGTFFTAMGQVAFAPTEGLVYAAQVGQIAYNGASKITDAEGQPINKDYLLNQIKTIGADINSITEGYTTLADGKMSLDDAGGAKLLADQDALNTLCLNKIYNPARDELRKVFKDYIDSVTTRNNQVLAYNAAINLVLQYSQQQQDLVQQAGALNDKVLANLSATIPGLTSFISQSYYAAREQLLRYMNLAARAYKFWCLEDVNLLTDQFVGKAPPDINSGVIASIQDNFWGEYADELGRLGNGAEFPQNADDLGVPVSITGAAIDVFKITRELLVNIPVETKETVSGTFVDMAGVRVTDVKVFLRGAKLKPDSAGDSILPVDITHTGHEQLVSTSNQIYSFTHEPVTRTFEYYVDSNKTYKPAAFEITAREDPNLQSNFALIGPYTYWHIKVNRNLPGLDLSNLTQIDIYFRGLSWSFQDMGS